MDDPGKPRTDISRAAMKLLGWRRRQHQLGRTRHIVAVMVRYGFAELASRLGLEALFGHGRRMPWQRRGRSVAGLSESERIVKALEELGPTFVKLGQVLSTRPDILSPDYIAALACLQDRVPGVDYDDVAALVRRELGAPPEEVFARFDREPLAAASLAQVHGARLKTGEEVVVKVQRPEVAEIVEGDLAILAPLARQAERRLPESAVFDPVRLVDEFGRSIRQELDYVREGQNCDICRRNFADNPEIVIPAMHWDYTTRRVLVQERLDGIKLTDSAALDAAGVDRHRLAVSGCRAYMQMVFDHGFFQADPHPGNLVLLADGRLGIVDYGMFSRIDDDTRELLVDMMLAAYERKPEALVRLVLQAGYTAKLVDEAALRADVGDLIDRYYGVELEKMSLGKTTRELLAVLRRHHIRIPPGLTMLLRGIGTIEGLGLMVDPTFRLVDEMKPFVKRVAWERFGPAMWLRSLRRSGADLESLVRTLPGDLRQIVDWLKRGEFKLTLDQEELREIFRNLGRSNNRL
jgi:ubiquinone biosynthesis protein